MEVTGHDVFVGGVSFRSLEERIRKLEAALEKQGTAEATPIPTAVADTPATGAKTATPVPRTKLYVVEKSALQAEGNREILPDYLAGSETARKPGETRDRVVVPEDRDRNFSDPEKEFAETQRGHPTRPTYTRMSRQYLSIETLEQLKIDFMIDRHDPEYVIIKRYISPQEQDYLWSHTRELRAKRPVISREGRHPAIDAPLKLDAKIKRLPFNQWDESEDKDDCVLEVATDVVAGDMKPVRLLIHSRYIRSGLRKTTKAWVDDFADIMLPPWKLLITYEKEIRDQLEEFDKEAAEWKEKLRRANEENSKRYQSSVTTEKPEDVEQLATEGKEQNGKKDQEQSPYDVQSNGKKVRFAEETQEIRTEHDGFAKVKVVKIPVFCGFCKSNHEKDYDCVSEVLSHWRCLIEFMDVDLKHVFELRAAVAAGTLNEISFDQLWHLFGPGDLLLTSEPRRAYKVFNVNGGRPCLTKNLRYEKRPRVKPLQVECTYIDVESRGFGPAHETIIFTEFGGKLSVKELPCTFITRPIHMPNVFVYPVQFEENSDEVLATLIRRGKRVLELYPFSHKYYRGISAVEGDELDSEIIIDVKTKEFARGRALAQQGTYGHIEYDVREIAEGCEHIPPTDTQIGPPAIIPDCRCWNVIDDFYADTARSEAYKGDAALLEIHPSWKIESLSDEHLMLFAPYILAWQFKLNQWWSIYIDEIQDLNPEGEFITTRSFERLVLPAGHEDLLKAVIPPYQNPGYPRRAEDEKSLIHLKEAVHQKNLNILLYGEPGVGKIKSAEAIAAYAGRPLYHIRCFDIDPDEDDLEQHLCRAKHWNCIVLIHNVDILLERRDSRYNQINITNYMDMLIKVLDQHTGIKIITTSRVKTFDDMLMSRIHLALHFPALTKAQTIEVWRRLLVGKLGNIEVPDLAGNLPAILGYVGKCWEEGARWDARQIRNALEIADAMAVVEGVVITLKQVMAVLQVTSHFADYHKMAIKELEVGNRMKGNSRRTETSTGD